MSNTLVRMCAYMEGEVSATTHLQGQLDAALQALREISDGKVAAKGMTDREYAASYLKMFDLDDYCKKNPTLVPISDPRGRWDRK